MTYLPKVKYVIADTKEHLELSTEELAKQLGVPIIQLEVWKRGYFDKEYYPLLILALIHLIDQRENNDKDKLLVDMNEVTAAHKEAA